MLPQSPLSLASLGRLPERSEGGRRPERSEGCLAIARQDRVREVAPERRRGVSSSNNIQLKDYPNLSGPPQKA